MRIHRLTLYSGNLEAQKQFYRDVLKLPLLNESETSVHFQVGDSILVFEQSEDQPYYHFAINIPSNQFVEAMNWLRSKVPLLRWEGKEAVDFHDWNAQAIYFYDKDRNIVEFIARENLQAHRNEPFTEKSLLHLSEVGVPTVDVRSVVEKLQETCGIQTYDGNLTRFNAAGGETGLFIIVNRTVKKWIPNMDEAMPFPFEVWIENESQEQFHLRYADDRLDG